MTIATDRSPRFPGQTANQPALQAAASLAISAIVALAAIGLLTPLNALAFFAVGAGAGYSLSGSV